MSKYPISGNEAERLLSLSNLDLDYTDLESDFKDIVLLVSKITEMDVTMVNLIDTFNQWTIASYGFKMQSMPREDSVCQFTIIENEQLEIKDLSAEQNLKEKFYVSGAPYFRYYFGIPLRTSNGVNIGSLCVLDRQLKNLSPEKIELLKIIADEIVTKLKVYKKMDGLKNELSDAVKMQKKIAQDIRNSLAGVIGISDILIEPNEKHKPEQILEYISLINESSKSILEIINDIVTDINEESPETNRINLEVLRERLSQLYMPLAKNKDVLLEFNINKVKQNILFSKNKILQIIGSPVSSAIKLSQAGSIISINLDIAVQTDKNILQVVVKSNTPAQDDLRIESTVMNFTKQLVENQQGKFAFSSNENNGLVYEITLPQSAL